MQYATFLLGDLQVLLHYLQWMNIASRSSNQLYMAWLTFSSHSNFYPQNKPFRDWITWKSDGDRSGEYHWWCSSSKPRIDCYVCVCKCVKVVVYVCQGRLYLCQGHRVVEGEDEEAWTSYLWTHTESVECWADWSGLPRWLRHQLEGCQRTRNKNNQGVILMSVCFILPLPNEVCPSHNVFFCPVHLSIHVSMHMCVTSCAYVKHC